MARHSEGAEFLNRLCDLRDAYTRRGADDREGSVSMETLLDHLAKIWDSTQVASEPSA